MKNVPNSLFIFMALGTVPFSLIVASFIAHLFGISFALFTSPDGLKVVSSFQTRCGFFSANEGSVVWSDENYYVRLYEDPRRAGHMTTADRRPSLVVGPAVADGNTKKFRTFSLEGAASSFRKVRGEHKFILSPLWSHDIWPRSPLYIFFASVSCERWDRVETLP